MNHLFEHHTVETPGNCPPLPEGYRVLSKEAAAALLLDPTRQVDATGEERTRMIESVAAGRFISAINQNGKIIWGWATDDIEHQAEVHLRVAELKVELEQFFKTVAPEAELVFVDLDDLGKDPDNPDVSRETGLPPEVVAAVHEILAGRDPLALEETEDGNGD